MKIERVMRQLILTEDIKTGQAVDQTGRFFSFNKLAHLSVNQSGGIFTCASKLTVLVDMYIKGIQTLDFSAGAGAGADFRIRFFV